MIGMSFSTRGPEEWIRGRAHVANGEIILDASEVETYFLRQPSNLPLDLAKLDEGKPEQIVALVRRYGLLWHGPDELETETGKLCEPVRDWERVGAELDNTIRFYMDLRHAGRDKPRDTLRHSASPLFADLFRQCLAEDESPWWTDEDYVALGNELLATWLDDKIRGCTMGVVPAAEQDVRNRQAQVLLSYHPSDLETAAYTELVMLIASQRELRSCKGCGGWFLPTSSKHLYHDPSCSTNTRQKRRRQQQSDGTETSQLAP